MPSPPYPNIPPNYQTVDETGGFRRSCYVLELLVIGEFDPIRRAALEDAIGVIIERFSEIEKHDLVRSDRFTTDLRRLLHVS
jgi:hypothetical protein